MKFLFFPLLFISLSVFAQPADIQAKSAFLAAQDAYGNGDYPTAIEKLEHVKELLGSTNPRVEHLLANAYFENGDYDQAQASLNSYFELAADSDINYLQMVRMVEVVRQKKAEAAQLAKQQAADKAAWQEAMSQKTIEGFEAYLEKFPEGQFAQNAKDEIKALPPLPLIDPRDGQEYKTVRIGDQVWMAENLRYNQDGSECLNGEIATCVEYGRLYLANNKANLCPEGWRLPSDDDYMILFQYTMSPEFYPEYMCLVPESDKKKQFLGKDWGGEDRYSFDLRKTNSRDHYWTMDAFIQYLSRLGKLGIYFLESDQDVVPGTSKQERKFCRCIKE